MATEYKGNSIVDYVKSTGGDASFSSRANLAVKQGIVKSAAEYIGSGAQNTSLLNKLRGAGTPAASTNNAASIINANQDADIENAPSEDSAPSRNESRTSRYSTAFSEVSELFNTGDKVEAPNFTEMFNKARKDFQLDDLEGYVNDLQTEEEQIYADLRERRTAERGKTVATNVIEGRIGQAERQEAERIDYISRQKNAAVRQLQSANATIENMINFTKLDYDTARNAYNDKFTQQMALFSTVKGLVDAEISDEEREADTARANLNIIYGSIREGELDTTSISPEMQYKINSMELSAGLPTGFYENLQNQNPEGEILSTTTRTNGNAKYADVLFKNKDGSITSKAIYLGGAASAGGSGGGGSDYTEAELERENRSIISGALNPVRGQDGYVAPEDYVSARNKAIASGVYSRDVFDKEFAREYVNPSDRDLAGVGYAFDILE